MRAGTDTRVITPSLDRPVYLAGFQGNRVATGVADDLLVRTLALAPEVGRPFALAVCDLIGMVREDTLAIREALPDVDVVVACTHTHSGPDTIGLWGSDERTSGVDPGYAAGVRDSVVASIRSAVASLEPAWLRFGSTEVHGIIRNFRDPAILDEQACVLSAERADGAPVATLVNLPLHPEVLDGSSTVISADVAGATCRAVEREQGGVAIWASGGLGGMQSPDTEVRTMDEVARMGAVIAGAVLRSTLSEPIRPEPRYLRTEVRLPLWNPMFRAGIESGLLRGSLDGDSLWTDVGLLDVPPARLAFLPGEVLPALAMAMKVRLATRFPFLIGLANDELGYVLPREAFVEPAGWDDPGPQYEESMSVGPETGPLLLDALQRLAGTAI